WLCVACMPGRRQFRSVRSSRSAPWSLSSSSAVTDAPIEIAEAREATTPPRHAWYVDPRLRRLGSGLVGATFWLLFAYANIHSSIESHRVMGLGVGTLGVWASVLFIVRRQPVQVSRSLPVWAIAYAGTF